MHKSSKYVIILIILLSSSLFSKMIYAQKNDTLFHTNGNILTGEVKKFTKGLLYFSMAGMGTIKVENEEIKSLKTNKFLRILTKNNEIFYGDIDSSSNWGELRIGLLDERTIIKVNDIVEIFPIKNTFWLRLSGHADLGLDYTKANKIFRVNGSGSINYQKEKWAWGIKYSGNDSWQNIDTLVYTSKNDINLSNEYILTPRWRLTSTIGRNTNTELGLQSRWFAGSYMKNFLLQTNRAYIDYIVGIEANIERNNSDESKKNLEVIIGGDFSIFKYQSPEISLNTYAKVIPSLVSKGRWRFDSGLDARIEVFTDFYLSFKVYFQYDSKPIEINANNNDYSFSTGFGYTFN